ncbi:MAG: DNA polymerase III subunit delta [Clostridia bacterium]|nr:DNA polymerase III subunit delta [Clostridia bacterium]
MKFKDLKKSFASGLMPIYLVTGDDAFLVERSTRLIIDACNIDEGLNLSSFEGGELKGNSEKLISALTSYPFMGDKRVVLAKEYYPLTADVKALKSYFEDPCETTVFIIANIQKSDAILKLPNVTEVDCFKGDEAVASMWIKSQANKGGVKITQGAIDKIISYSNADMTKINGEIEKLVAYALNKGEITQQDVEALCVKETEYQLYEVVEFISAKKYENAYTCLVEMMSSYGDGQKLFVSLYYHYRRMLYSALSQESDAEVARYLKVKEFAVKMARRQAKAYSVKRLKQIVDALALYDEKFKQGYVEQGSAVWNSVFNVLVE